MNVLRVVSYVRMNNNTILPSLKRKMNIYGINILKHHKNVKVTSPKS